MLRIALLACFVAVCYAQTPVRPMIPGSFMAKVTVDRREGMGPGKPVVETKGEGMIERNMEGRMSREGFKVGEGNGTYEVGRLDRFDMNEYFDVFKRDRDPKFHCEKHMVPPQSQLVGFFEWVHRAAYNGTVMVEGVKYDSWVLIEPDIGELRELLVKPMDANTPSVYVRARVERLHREEEFEEEIVVFTSFTPGAPPMDDFKIPDECMM